MDLGSRLFNGVRNAMRIMLLHCSGGLVHLRGFLNAVCYFVNKRTYIVRGSILKQCSVFSDVIFRDASFIMILTSIVTARRWFQYDADLVGFGNACRSVARRVTGAAIVLCLATRGSSAVRVLGLYYFLGERSVVLAG